MSRWHCRDSEGVLMCFLLSDRFMNTVVLNRAGSMRVLLDSKQCDTSFRWIEGEAPSEYAGEPCSFTDNVKRVLMHGLSWHQFKVQHGYFNFGRDGSGLNLQSKISSLSSICWPARLRLMRLCELDKQVCIRESFVSPSAQYFGAFWQEEKKASPTAEGSRGQSTPLKRWRPFGPHPVACWVGDTLTGTWCGRCQRSKIDLRGFIWQSGNALKEWFDILGNILTCVRAESLMRLNTTLISVR